MKHLRILPLAALFAIAMSASFASTVSATTVEDVNGSHPTVIDLSLIGSSIFSSGETVLGTCTGGTVEGDSTTGSTTTTVKVPITAANMTWSGCTKTKHTIEGGELEIHHIAGTSNGTVTGAGFKWTTLSLGVTCTYGISNGPMVHLGTMTGSDATPILHINTTVIKRTGSFICPGTANWKATYHVTTPNGLTVTAG